MLSDPYGMPRSKQNNRARNYMNSKIQQQYENKNLMVGILVGKPIQYRELNKSGNVLHIKLADKVLAMCFHGVEADE
jgi:hypothetical protein